MEGHALCWLEAKIKTRTNIITEGSSILTAITDTYSYLMHQNWHWLFEMGGEVDILPIVVSTRGHARQRQSRPAASIRASGLHSLVAWACQRALVLAPNGLPTSTNWGHSLSSR